MSENTSDILEARLKVFRSLEVSYNDATPIDIIQVMVVTIRVINMKSHGARDQGMDESAGNMIEGNGRELPTRFVRDPGSLIRKIPMLVGWMTSVSLVTFFVALFLF